MKKIERNLADPVAVRNADILNQELTHVPKIERYFGDASAGAVTFYLPDGYDNDFDFYVIKTDSSVNTVTIEPFGTQTIEGVGNLVLSAQYDKALLAFYRGIWYVISP